MGRFFSSLFHLGENISHSRGQKIAAVCDVIIQLSLYILAIGLPLFFLPWTSEALEFNKQVFLFAFSSIAVLAWFGRILAIREFRLRSTVVNVIVVLFAVVYIISTLVSQNVGVSFLGDISQQKASLLSTLAFVGLYFVIANSLETMKQVRQLLSALLFGGFFALLFAVFQGFGSFLLPFDFAKSASFTTIGTTVSVGVFASVMAMLSAGMLVAPHGGHVCEGAMCWIRKLILSLVCILSIAVVAMIDFNPVLVALLVGSVVLIGYAVLHVNVVRGVRGIAFPIIGFVMSVFLLFLSFPVKLQFPSEVMPSLGASANITYATLREKPLFGSGPSTFIYDFSKYRSEDINNTQFWNIRFDRSQSRLLTIAATTGLFGILVHLLMIAFVFFSSVVAFLKRNDETWHTMIGVFGAWCALLASRVLYNSNMTLEFLFWFLTALLVVTIVPILQTSPLERTPRAGILSSFIFIIVGVGSVACVFIFSQRYLADTAYAYALKINAQGDKETVIAHLEKAVKYQSNNDLYLRNLASVRLQQAIANGKTVVDKKNEEAVKAKDALSLKLANDAIVYAIRATQVNTSNVANWITLADVYSNVMLVAQDAGDKAVAAYEMAISLEPTNPVLHLQLGKVYLTAGESYRTAIKNTNDQEQAKQLQAELDQVLVKTVEYFEKSIALKSDFSEGYFNLAVALDRQGKLKDAIAKMEKVLSMNQSDYGVGFQLASLYYRDGKKDKAMQLMEAVVKLVPQFADARWFLSTMHEEKGNLDGAIEQIMEILKYTPDEQTVKDRLAALQAKKVGAAVPAEPAGLVPAKDVVNPNEKNVK
jgi:tetratricopeptide (TPR) repeat protein